MKRIVSAGQVVGCSASDDYAMAFFRRFDKNGACQFRHLLAVEMIGIDDAALCAPSPEKPAHTREEGIRMFVEFLDRLHIDICHFSDVED